MYAHEIALVIAAVTPVAVVVGIDIYLALHGETGTLLLPRIFAFPSQPIVGMPAPVATVEVEVEEMQMEPLRKAA